MYSVAMYTAHVHGTCTRHGTARHGTNDTKRFHLLVSFVSCRAVPCRTVPYRAMPCRAVPCRAVPWEQLIAHYPVKWPGRCPPAGGCPVTRNNRADSITFPARRQGGPPEGMGVNRAGHVPRTPHRQTHGHRLTETQSHSHTQAYSHTVTHSHT